MLDHMKNEDHVESVGWYFLDCFNDIERGISGPSFASRMQRRLDAKRQPPLSARRAQAQAVSTPDIQNRRIGALCCQSTNKFIQPCRIGASSSIVRDIGFLLSRLEACRPSIALLENTTCGHRKHEIDCRAGTSPNVMSADGAKEDRLSTAANRTLWAAD